MRRRRRPPAKKSSTFLCPQRPIHASRQRSSIGDAQGLHLCSLSRALERWTEGAGAWRGACDDGGRLTPLSASEREREAKRELSPLALFCPLPSFSHLRAPALLASARARSSICAEDLLSEPSPKWREDERDPGGAQGARRRGVKKQRGSRRLREAIDAELDRISSSSDASRLSLSPSLSLLSLSPFEQRLFRLCSAESERERGRHAIVERTTKKNGHRV